ncbi:hypothetical protein ABZW30_13010 [Kitasatospora sp. NPDC004669]|uniref:hypothetical protein n=1 Tax=Kitasatospora sp. NPDC004669 TaxID=3154555 RepID=UPI0033B0852F
MTSTAAARRPITELPHDPSYVQVNYGLETSLGGDPHESTIERWSVSAGVGEDFDLDHIPACAACLDRWARVEKTSGFVDEEDDCPHRLHVGEFVFYKVRWDGGMNPFWAMEEETQELYEIAEAVFNDERNDFNEEFNEIVEMHLGGSDLLVLDRAQLAPLWRGFNLGPILAAEAIRRLAGGCGAVLVHPAPAEAEDLTSDQWKHARERLRDTWAKVGFVPYSDTPYMVLSTCWADPEQRHAELQKELKLLSAQWQAARRAGS